MKNLIKIIFPLISSISAQNNIQNDDSIQRDTVRSVEGNEMIEYLKDVSSDQVSVQCLQQKMCITIEKQFLVDKEITTHHDKLELRNITDKCSNTYINSNTDPDNWESQTHVELCTTDGFLSCGTRMEMNDTHVSYINQIVTKNEENQDPGLLMAPIIREYVIPWHCIYPLEYVVGLETQGTDGPGDGGYYIPEISPIEYITIQSPLLQKENTYPVFMQLFETNNFRTPFTEAPTLSNNDKLFVEVKMVGPSDATIQMVNCWATPFGGQSQNELNDYRFDIIKDYCVTEDASNSIAANILKNGQSQNSQYEANVFKYNRNVGTDKVYLHCNVRVCFKDNQQCDVVGQPNFCGGKRRRKRRDLNAELALDPSITTVHAGPFTLVSDDVYQVIGEQLNSELAMAKYELEIENQIINNRKGIYSNNNKEIFGLPLMFVYCFIAIIIIIISLIFGIIFLVVRRRSSAKQNALEKTVRIIEQPNGQTYVVSANGKQILSTVEQNSSNQAQVSRNNSKIMPSHSTLAASGHQNNAVLSSVVNTASTQIMPQQLYHAPRSPGAQHPRIVLPTTLSETDRQNSRMTHQTYLPHSDESERTHSIASSKTLHTQQTFAGDCSTSSESGQSRCLFEGVPNSVSVPSRSPSQNNHNNNNNNPVTVAKVRQDSYYRLQAHNNNIVNAYMHQNQ